ncbi:MAG: L,D-transpeptidase [Verrucomicrobiales bacterium]
MFVRLFILSAAAALLGACSTVPKSPVAAEDTTTPRWKICDGECAAVPDGKVRIDISLASSTAQLLGPSGALLAEMDISPGLPEHATPTGRFRIREKLPLKRSNLYGQYVTADTKEVVVARAWEHKGPRPAGTVYQGIAMPYWLRVTDDGIGIHVGGFNRGQPTSHGCVRCPEPPQKVFWEKSRVGTPVHIHTGPHPAPSLLNPPAAITAETSGGAGPA